MLYIVSTPIGNLEDITLRALRILKEVDFILCEDTRVTQKLLNHYSIKAKTISFHEYSDESKFEKILNLLSSEKNVALVTDAGTPCVSDPGAYLVSLVRQKMPDVKIVPIPGPSALVTAVSISGLKNTEFVFLGFPPHKKGRETFFKKIASFDMPVIFYESKHRIIKSLQSLEKFSPDKKVKVFKELTKIHENVFSGSPLELIKIFEENKDLQKGEFVILVE